MNTYADIEDNRLMSPKEFNTFEALSTFVNTTRLFKEEYYDILVTNAALILLKAKELNSQRELAPLLNLTQPQTSIALNLLRAMQRQVA